MAEPEQEVECGDAGGSGDENTSEAVGRYIMFTGNYSRGQPK